MPPDPTSLLHALRTTDAMHDPGEANALLSAAAAEITWLRQILHAILASDMAQAAEDEGRAVYELAVARAALGSPQDAALREPREMPHTPSSGAPTGKETHD